MDFELSLQAPSRSCADSEEPNTPSQPSESLDDTVGSPEKLDGYANVTATAQCTQQDNGSLSVEGETEKVEDVSKSASNMLDSADIELIQDVPPPGSLPGEQNPVDEVAPEVCMTIDIHMEEDRVPPCSLAVPTGGLAEVNDLPSSSPPVSSPLTSGYFRSSSPIPPASSPCGYDLTPPTSPVKIHTKLANIPIDKFKEVSDVEPLEFIFDQSQVDLKENDETFTATVVDEHESNTSKSISPEDCLPKISDNKGDTHPLEQGITPREKVYQRLIPGPKRATLAAQKVQHQRLSKPFRPPTVQKAIANVTQENSPSSDNDAAYKPVVHTPSFAEKMQEKMKNRTAKAAAQFKPPAASSSAGGVEGPLVRPTPTIQALERKLQLLKRAVKVKENCEEEILSGLIQKWTEAGREIAWEVWGLVKENGEGVRKRGMEESWGWQDAGDSKRQKTEERLWGWDVVPVCEVEEGPRRTVGTMLLEMGIAPVTFGWNVDEERFED